MGGVFFIVHDTATAFFALLIAAALAIGLVAQIISSLNRNDTGQRRNADKQALQTLQTQITSEQEQLVQAALKAASKLELPKKSDELSSTLPNPRDGAAS